MTLENLFRRKTILKSTKLEFANGKPKVKTREMKVPDSVNRNRIKKGKVNREYFDVAGPSEIGPGTRKK